MPNTFKLTDQHIKLLRSAYVCWYGVEFGSPCIDPKRPYGNSDVCGDIAEILGMEFDEAEGLSDEMVDKLTKLHEETETALQIVLLTGEFKPGNYVRDNAWSNWKPAN